MRPGLLRKIGRKDQDMNPETSSEQNHVLMKDSCESG